MPDEKNNTNNNSRFVFTATRKNKEDLKSSDTNDSKKMWKIIVADDDEDVHALTKMILKNFTFENKKLLILDSYSGKDTKSIIKENPDTAIILLDVVMESENAGINVIKYIREILKNTFVRIIIRTGQPGQAPENEIIAKYDINDYKEKTELTSQKLYSSIISSLRSYRDLRTIEEKNIELKKVLKERDVLLREVHHRVKNNLQIMISLLRLKARLIENDDVRNMFIETKSRIIAMALVHENLYHSKDISRISFPIYITNLISSIYRNYYVNNSLIKLNKNIQDILFDIDFAVPCGLLINEIITNSIKYAFPKGKGEITIDVKQTNDDIQIIVSDNGVGLPKDINISNSNSLGLQLISILVKQLNAKIELDRTNGTKYIITFNQKHNF